MNRKILALFALVITSSALTGCENTQTPEGILKTAYQAILRQDLQAFTTTLSGPALLDFGTEEGMEKIYNEIKFQSIVGFEKKTVPNKNEFSEAGFVTTFQMTVFTSNFDTEKSFQATVRCVDRLESVGRDIEFLPNVPVVIGSNQQITVTKCMIEEIKL